MSDTKYSFWKLINDYEIEIPMIQRDYAQGRNEGAVPHIRKNILANLSSALNDDKPLDFDFIYGRIEEQPKQKARLIPIDGQQRLTTLFLLHWYFATQDQVGPELIGLLNGFRYATRTSSREFCKAIVDHADSIQLDGSLLTDSLKDSAWFISSWEMDPTVASMFVMLDAIHSTFSNSSGLFAKITDKYNSPITFQFTEMQQLGLTDSVYIKMNSRGKSLTEFENFKASFEQFLENKHPIKKEEFAKHVDGSWTEFFWKHRVDNLIDEPFMNFFNYITKILYYNNLKECDGIDFIEFQKMPNEPDYWVPIYQDICNIEFLFSSLHLLVKWDVAKSFFDSFFSGKSHIENRVAIFHDETDLFERCIKNQEFNIPEEVLLYLIILYCLGNEDNEDTSELCDRIRVLRNRLERVRQLNWPVYNNNLRYINMKKYLNAAKFLAVLNIPIYNALIDNINFASFPGDTVQLESKKASIIFSNPAIKKNIHQIEDDQLFKGSIHGILSDSNNANLEELYSSFKEIWSCGNFSLIVRAMLASEFCGIYVGNSGIGSRWFFGHNEHWYTLLTFIKDEDSIDIIHFLNVYEQIDSALTCSEKLNHIVDQWISSHSDYNDWRYYFIKYPKMLSTEISQFTWPDEKCNFEIRRLRTKTAIGYHINPYVYTVGSIINNDDICDLHQCYAQGSEISPLRLKNETLLWSEESGWRIIVPDGVSVPTQEFPSLFSTSSHNEYLLRETSEKDRIEIAVDFVQSLFGQEL